MYEAKEKFDNGQEIFIQFQEDYIKKGFSYSLHLGITSNRKNIFIDEENCISTGKLGIKTLLWAKEKIIQFEEYIKDTQLKKAECLRKKPPKRIIIYCCWTNKRRRDVYYYGLSKIGYKFNMLFGRKVIMKKL